MAKNIQHSTLHRISNQTPHFRQLVFSESKSGIFQTQNQLSAGPTSRALSQCGRTCYLHIQKPHHCNTEHYFNFPLAEWDRLLPHAVITLNILLSSNLHPSLLAHASLFGNFNYNQVPLAPPGTKVVAHMAADKRHSFAPHRKVGWYIVP